jgi:hypothetical protein
MGSIFVDLTREVRRSRSFWVAVVVAIVALVFGGAILDSLHANSAWAFVGIVALVVIVALRLHANNRRRW